MSAGFEVADRVFWGTNGAIEVYVEAMAVQAAARLGLNHPLTAYMQEERDGFYGGKVLFLDEWLTDATTRQAFIEVFDAATEQLMREEAFTDFGREWVGSVVADLRTRAAGER